MTTFPSRETVRDALVALCIASNSWKGVYGYGAAASVIAKGTSPALIIRSRGTRQQMAGRDTNPRSYRFSLQSWVLATSEIAADNWTSDEAEDKVDALDQTLCQVLRDNANNAVWDNIRFASEYSDVVDLNPDVPFIVETRFIYVDLERGAI